MLVRMLWRKRTEAVKTVEGLRAASFDDAQLSATLSLIRSCAARSEAVVPYSVPSFRAAYLGPGSRPERDITLLLKPRRAVGIALVSTKRQYVQAGRVYLEVLHVAPRHAGPDPVHLLVRTAKEKLVNDDLPLNGMFAFLDDSTMRSEQLYLEQMGFRRMRCCRYLVFSPPPDYPGPRFPDGFRLVRERIPGHEPQIAARFNSAFMPPSLVPAVPENFRPLPGDVWLIPDGALFLYDGEELAGGVQILRHYERRKAMAFVARLGVVKKYRGRGYGRQLLRAAVEAGRSYGLEGVKLTVYSDTPDAEHIYLSEGFTEQSCTSELSWDWGSPAAPGRP
ncbi:MAG TPA: GNAT family N-acetyltransferase [Thermoleophilia bacterium]|nr:GNAT family N-acetyltransferase [Thermoleophilia bacterium]